MRNHSLSVRPSTASILIRLLVVLLVASYLSAATPSDAAFKPGPARMVNLSYARTDAKTNRAAIMIVHGKGKPNNRCIAFTEPEITGLDLLERTGVDLSVDAGNAVGVAVCQIGKEGCSYPSQTCFCQCQGSSCTYWSYWQLDGGNWKYSDLGASLAMVHNGDVQAWVWEAGTTSSAPPPPPITFNQVCTAGAGKTPTVTITPPTSTDVPPTGTGTPTTTTTATTTTPTTTATVTATTITQTVTTTTTPTATATIKPTKEPRLTDVFTATPPPQLDPNYGNDDNLDLSLFETKTSVAVAAADGPTVEPFQRQESGNTTGVLPTPGEAFDSPTDTSGDAPVIAPDTTDTAQQSVAPAPDRHTPTRVALAKAQNGTAQSETQTNESSISAPLSTNTRLVEGAILVGGVVMGGSGLVVLVGGLIWYTFRRRWW